MNIIKFSKNVTDKIAQGIDIVEAEKVLDKLNIRSFAVKQNDNEQWKLHGTKKHDLVIAIQNMTQEEVDKLATEKLVINLQSDFRNDMMTALGIGTETADTKKKRKLHDSLAKKGLSEDDIQDVIALTFNK